MLSFTKSCVVLHLQLFTKEGLRVSKLFKYEWMDGWMDGRLDG